MFTIPWEIEDYLKEYEKSLFKQNEQIVKLKASLEKEVAEKNIVIEKLINSLEELDNDPSVLREIKERRAEVEKCQSELAKNLKSTEQMYKDLDIMAKEFSESTLHLYFSSGPEVRRSIYLDLIESCVIIDKVITVIYRNGKKYIIKIPYRILKDNYIIDVYYKDLFQTSAILENNVLSYPRDRFIQLGENIHPDTLDEQYEIGKGIFIQTNKYMSNAIA